MSDSLRIKNTFIEPVDSDAELDLPCKSLSAPSIKVSDSSPRAFCMNPAPTSPLEALKEPRKRDGSKTPKCLRFDFAPSFFGGNVRDDECDLAVQSSAVSEESKLKKIHPYLALPESNSLSYTVKNTFVHLHRSSAEDADCDLDLPRRSVSAPTMPTLSGTTPTGTECVESELLASDTPSSTRENAPSFPVEPLDDDGASDSMAPGRPHLPMGFSLPATPGLSSQASGSRTFNSSALDSSCSFRVKNTFIHVDVDKNVDVDDEEDFGFGLPIKRRERKCVSQPELTFQQDASLSSAPAAPKSVSQPELVFEQSASLMSAAEARPLPSLGAALHGIGECKPCAWFWKPESCQWGAECRHCHLCPMGELRRRKKERQVEAKELKRAAVALAEAAVLPEKAGLQTDMAFM